VSAQRTPESSGGKHRKSPEGNVWREAAPTPKNTASGSNQRFSAIVPSQMDSGNADTWKMQVAARITAK